MQQHQRLKQQQQQALMQQALLQQQSLYHPGLLAPPQVYFVYQFNSSNHETAFRIDLIAILRCSLFYGRVTISVMLSYLKV